MKKYTHFVLSSVLILSMLGVGFVEAKTFTASQVNAIVSLLQSFGVNSQVVANVGVALGTQTNTSSASAPLASTPTSISSGGGGGGGSVSVSAPTAAFSNVLVPTINYLSVSQGVVGQYVTIYGTNFATSDLVTIGLKYAMNPTKVTFNGAQLQFIIPNIPSDNYQIGINASGTVSNTVSLNVTGGYIAPLASATTSASSSSATTSVSTGSGGGGSYASGGSASSNSNTSSDFSVQTSKAIMQPMVSSTSPQITSFTVSSSSLSLGQSFILAWTSINTTGCNSSNFIPSGQTIGLATNGSLSLTPTQQANSYTYSMWCLGTDGSTVTSNPVTVTMVPPSPSQLALLPDLTPTPITYSTSSLVAGQPMQFHSGVTNLGPTGTGNMGPTGKGIFNVKWFVDGVQVGYGSTEAIGPNTTDMNGNSGLNWTPVSGTHTIEFLVNADLLINESNINNDSTTTTVIVP